MSLQTLLHFIPACFALNMAFGPNNLLSLLNGASHGITTAVVAAIGRLLAFFIMIVIAGVGLGALLMTSEVLFSFVKWAGTAYLIWIGIKLILTKSSTKNVAQMQNGNQTLMTMAQKEFIIAASNPKAILIFTAFFPQFIEPNAYAQSFTVMGITFLLLEVIAIAIYALIGARIGSIANKTNAFKWVNKISGSIMIFFGVLLAFARRPVS